MKHLKCAREFTKAVGRGNARNRGDIGSSWTPERGLIANAEDEEMLS